MSNLIIPTQIKNSSKKKSFLNIPGDFLLSHAGFPRSTIGAMSLNFRVRDGIGCYPHAIVTGKNFREIE